MPRSATLLSISTIALWSFLAFLGSQVNRVPPFLLVGIALTVGGFIGIWKIGDWRVPITTFAVGVYGIFGYHFLLFSAFQIAPAVEANLMNYLWPLLIVLLTPLFLTGQRLRPHHILGALTGLAGATLIVTGGRFSLDIGNLKGYLMAASAAFIWASYSLLTKRVPAFPTAAVAGFCFFSGLLSLGVFFTRSLSLQAVQALSAHDWIFLVLLGAGPMGLAFFTWDAALKRGDPRIIGSLAYITPLTSTMLLVLAGGRRFTWISAISMVLIFSGAVIGSWDLFRSVFRKMAGAPGANGGANRFSPGQVDRRK
jgi:drug/metabolite transporter (DMT)-like permease